MALLIIGIFPMGLPIACIPQSPARQISQMSPEGITEISDPALCAAYGDHRAVAIYNELLRRGILSDADFKLAMDRSIAIGMSELALLAAWGSPESINRTVGVWGEHRQYVYPTGRAYHNKYVYTQDGIVTSYQD